MGRRIWRIVHVFFLAMGVLWSLMVLLAFTSLPFHIWYRYSMHFAGITRPPDYVVLLGGGGMPSESNLMRCWYAAKAAHAFPRSRVILALPGDSTDSTSALNGMKRELVFRGIDPRRILLEDSGANTRAQALSVREMVQKLSMTDAIPHETVLLVSAPEHIYRSVLTFREAGFRSINALPAFDQAIESDITFHGEQLGGRRWIPDIGNQVTLRYRFWTQIHYEIIVIREWMAVSYYWVKGWI